MADGDRNPEFVGQHLQFQLPQAQTHVVAAAAIRGNQQSRRGGIAGGTEFVSLAAMLSTDVGHRHRRSAAPLGLETVGAEIVRPINVRTDVIRPSAAAAAA
jgi:hypothetical protein